jgi:hypothetical protein
MPTVLGMPIVPVVLIGGLLLVGVYNLFKDKTGKKSKIK